VGIILRGDAAAVPHQLGDLTHTEFHLRRRRSFDGRPCKENRSARDPLLCAAMGVLPARTFLVLLGLLTLLLFGGGGAWLVHAQGRSLPQVVFGVGPWWHAVLAGIAVGTLMGFGAWAVAST